MSWLTFDTYYGFEKSNPISVNTFASYTPRFDEEMNKFLSGKEVDKDFLKLLLDGGALGMKVYPRGIISDDILLYIYRIIALGDREGFSALDNSTKERYEHDWNQYNDKRRMLSLALQIPIWLIEEDEMPKYDSQYSIEYFGCYDCKTPSLVICPKRIEEISAKLSKEKNINIAPQVLYAIVFIHLLAYAMMDNANVLDGDGNLCEINRAHNCLNQELFDDARKALANSVVLQYFDQACHSHISDYPIVKEFMMIQPYSHRIGISEYEVLHTDWRKYMESTNMSGSRVSIDDN